MTTTFIFLFICFFFLLCVCSYRTFATYLISISCVGSANLGVTTIVLATSDLCDLYASFRTGPAAAKAVSMSVTERTSSTTSSKVAPNPWVVQGEWPFASQLRKDRH